ncbi:MAG TPA: hypothetical protein QF621_00500, partial [Candidatus Thalassarchaeaceae archaeon]|nr:hypothetical protein [Candidatus Thalassarchaeaceae archaeon]
LPSAGVLGTTGELGGLADLEKHLAEMDSESSVREETVNGVPPPANPEHRSELASLEDELSDLEL